MKEINVNLGDRSYPILIGENLISSKSLFTEKINSEQIMIISNSTIEPLYLSALEESFSGYNVQSCILPDGESYKTLQTMNDVISALLENRFNRDCCLVALGGGVIGDITGFAAACYQRGVNFIQIPTTLLAQVDSSVGGKTGVNHALGKNMIGAFHQPSMVVTDVNVLRTLPERELIAGLAEVIKYGLIRDKDFFLWLDENINALLAREPEKLEYAIEISCRNKAEVVAEDEKEGGVRAILNFGHTFGHAVETALNYKEWLHGEAVGLGMIMAADLSHKMGQLSDAELEQTINLIKKTGLPTELPAQLSGINLRELMSVDKKSRAGKLNLVVLNGIGTSIVTNDFRENLLQETLATY